MPGWRRAWGRFALMSEDGDAADEKQCWRWRTTTFYLRRGAAERERREKRSEQQEARMMGRRRRERVSVDLYDGPHRHGSVGWGMVLELHASEQTPGRYAKEYSHPCVIHEDETGATGRHVVEFAEGSGCGAWTRHRILPLRQGGVPLLRTMEPCKKGASLPTTIERLLSQILT